jgi:hypothetical protein
MTSDKLDLIREARRLEMTYKRLSLMGILHSDLTLLWDASLQLRKLHHEVEKAEEVEAKKQLPLGVWVK